jgi:hypothetical protein
VFIDGESFHFYDVDQVLQDLFEETEEGVVAHNAEHSLSDSYLELSRILAASVEGF